MKFFSLCELPNGGKHHLVGADLTYESTVSSCLVKAVQKGKAVKSFVERTLRPYEFSDCCAQKARSEFSDFENPVVEDLARRSERHLHLFLALSLLMIAGC